MTPQGGSANVYAGNFAQPSKDFPMTLCKTIDALIALRRKLAQPGLPLYVYDATGVPQKATLRVLVDGDGKTLGIVLAPLR